MSSIPPTFPPLFAQFIPIITMQTCYQRFHDRVEIWLEKWHHRHNQAKHLTSTKFSRVPYKYKNNFPFTFHFEFSLSPHADYTRFRYDVRLFFAGFPLRPPRSYDHSQDKASRKYRAADRPERASFYSSKKLRENQRNSLACLANRK